MASVEDYDGQLLEQGGVCAICGKAPKGRLQVDHDHRRCPRRNGSCGKCVRGLLCFRCNYGLSWFGDDEEALQRAADYVARRSKDG
jgi:hypothetical protein